VSLLASDLKRREKEKVLRDQNESEVVKLAQIGGSLVAAAEGGRERGARTGGVSLRSR
jgi:hypothetical protein